MSIPTVVIKAEELQKEYSLYSEKIIALKKINLSIQRGEFVSIMGPSGAGKTTFLNLAGCLDTITEGSLEVLGSEVSLLNEREKTYDKAF